MPQFETIAKYYKVDENPVIVHCDQASESRLTFVAAPSGQGESRSNYMQGSMGVNAVQPDIVVLRDMTEGRYSHVSAMLAHAALHKLRTPGDHSHVVTTVAPADVDKMAFYTDKMGFVDKGLTRKVDGNGEPQQEVILVSSGNVRAQARGYLNHEGFQVDTHDIPNTSIFRPSKWDDDYGD
jgi:hypothetical protein